MYNEVHKLISTSLPRRARPLRLAFALPLFILFATEVVNPHYTIAEQPNVIVVLVDDLGWADLGCYGSKFHKTPNLDRLAAQGMRFTQAYAAAPIGLPTRAAILNGRYPQRLQMTASAASLPGENRYRMTAPAVSKQLPLSETLISEVLKGMGYRTGFIGKWSLSGPGFGPSEQGFDLNVGGNATSLDYSLFAPYRDEAGNMLPGLEQAPEGEFLYDRVAAEAQKFIAEQKSNPFFLYISHFGVHKPTVAKADLLAKYGPMPLEPNGKQINPVYAALLESLDESIGRILATLDEQNLSKRTMVVITSDNGGVCNSNGQIIPPTSNSPLRDGMGHLYEGGLRVPLIITWPDKVKSETVCQEIVSCLDLFPTIIEAAGGKLPVPQSEERDGVSLLPVLTGSGHIQREALFWHFPHYNVNAGARPGGAIRSGDWKLVEFFETGRRELFNIGAEIGEGKNLIEQYPDIVQSLASKMESWRKSVGAVMPLRNPEYTPNPQHEDGHVTMPASTADVYGVMLRYEPLPNKDTLGYWVRADDWAQFEFTLKRPGKYRLIPHVGCGTNGGSLVHFEVSGQTLPLTVPATGHFQKFVPQDLGTVSFDRPGPYVLTVKPQKKEGVAVMDIRRIELKPE